MIEVFEEEEVLSLFFNLWVYIIFKSVALDTLGFLKHFGHSTIVKLFSVPGFNMR